jgi:hypothetical protein
MDNVQKHNCYIMIIIYCPPSPLHLVLLSQMQSSHCQHQHQYLYYLCITVLSPFCLYSHNRRISCYYFCALLPCPHKILSLLFSLLSSPTSLPTAYPLYNHYITLSPSPLLSIAHCISWPLIPTSPPSPQSTVSLSWTVPPSHNHSLAVHHPSPYKGKGKAIAVTGFRRLKGL